MGPQWGRSFVVYKDPILNLNYEGAWVFEHFPGVLKPQAPKALAVQLKLP